MYNHPALKSYIRRIKHVLPCSGEEKEYLIEQLQESILDYLEDNPDADLSAIQEHFGTPKEIVGNYLLNQDTPVLLHKLSSKKKIIGIVAWVIALVLLILLTTITLKVYDDQKTNNGYFIIAQELDEPTNIQ